MNEFLILRALLKLNLSILGIIINNLEIINKEFPNIADIINFGNSCHIFRIKLF